MPLTQDELTQLQQKISKLTDDKTAADQATAASTQAHVRLTSAQAEAAAADTAEAQADGQVTADLTDLRAFVDNLAPAPSQAPESPPAGAPRHTR